MRSGLGLIVLLQVHSFKAKGGLGRTTRALELESKGFTVFPISLG